MHAEHDPGALPADPISFDDFLKVDIRVGTCPWRMAGGCSDVRGRS